MNTLQTAKIPDVKEEGEYDEDDDDEEDEKDESMENIEVVPLMPWDPIEPPISPMSQTSDESESSNGYEDPRDTDMDEDVNMELSQESLPERRPTISNDENIPSPDTEDDDMLMDHVLLPRVPSPKTPEKLSDLELNIISQMTKIVGDWATKGLPRKTADLLQLLKRFHNTYSPETVSEKLNSLRPGDNFAMFVRAQHCVILIHMPIERNENNVTVAVFPGSLDPSEIYIRDSGIEVKSFNFDAN